MEYYIFIAVMIVVMLSGMFVSYLRGKYVERIRIIRELMETSAETDMDANTITVSADDLSHILFDEETRVKYNAFNERR